MVNHMAQCQQCYRGFVGNAWLQLKRGVSRVQGRLDSLVTKADLAEFEMRLVKWMVGMMVASIAAASSIALLVQKMIGD